MNTESGRGGGRDRIVTTVPAPVAATITTDPFPVAVTITTDPAPVVVTITTDPVKSVGHQNGKDRWGLNTSSVATKSASDSSVDHNQKQAVAPTISRAQPHRHARDAPAAREGDTPTVSPKRKKSKNEDWKRMLWKNDPQRTGEDHAKNKLLLRKRYDNE